MTDFENLAADASRLAVLSSNRELFGLASADTAEMAALLQRVMPALEAFVPPSQRSPQLDCLRARRVPWQYVWSPVHQPQPTSADERPLVAQLRDDAAAIRERAVRRLEVNDTEGAVHLHGLALKFELLADRQSGTYLPSSAA